MDLGFVDPIVVVLVVADLFVVDLVALADTNCVVSLVTCGAQ